GHEAEADTALGRKGRRGNRGLLPVCIRHLLLIQLAQGHRNRGFGAVAPDGQLDSGVGRLAGNGAAEVECVIDRVASDGGDDVARLHARRTSRAVLGDIADDGTLGLFKADTIGDVTGYVLDADAEIAAGNGPGLDQLADDALDRGGRNGEGDADIAAVG